jgi:hypothetical protein
MNGMERSTGEPCVGRIVLASTTNMGELCNAYCFGSLCRFGNQRSCRRGAGSRPSGGPNTASCTCASRRRCRDTVLAPSPSRRGLAGSAGVPRPSVCPRGVVARTLRPRLERRGVLPALDCRTGAGLHSLANSWQPQSEKLLASCAKRPWTAAAARRLSTAPGSATDASVASPARTPSRFYRLLASRRLTQKIDDRSREPPRGRAS